MKYALIAISFLLVSPDTLNTCKYVTQQIGNNKSKSYDLGVWTMTDAPADTQHILVSYPKGSRSISPTPTVYFCLTSSFVRHTKSNFYLQNLTTSVLFTKKLSINNITHNGMALSLAFY